MRKKYFNLQEVFTPSQPANYTFIRRDIVNKRLKRALNTPGKQIIIYGYSGAGKTTLLTNTLKEEKITPVITRCILGMTLSEILIDAFNQLEVFYISHKETSESDKIGGNLSASYFGIKASLGAETVEGGKSSVKRAVELPINPQTLAKFIGEAGKCWVLEDYHKIKSEDKKQLAQVMKVFMDSSIDYSNLKIIAIGAVNSAREVVQFDPEMKSRISEIEVPLMTIDNLKNIISEGERLLNIKFPIDTIKKIVSYSSGLPAVTHQLALLLCEEESVNKTVKGKTTSIKKSAFDFALDEFISENSDTYKSIYENATKIVHSRKLENPKDLLISILSINKEQVSVYEVKDEILKTNSDYQGTNLKKYLHELTTPSRSEILRYNRDSGLFFFSNPFIKAYTQCIIRNELKPETINQASLLKELKTTLNRELEIAKEAFLRDFEL